MSVRAVRDFMEKSVTQFRTRHWSGLAAFRRRRSYRRRRKVTPSSVVGVPAPMGPALVEDSPAGMRLLVVEDGQVFVGREEGEVECLAARRSECRCPCWLIGDLDRRRRLRIDGLDAHEERRSPWSRRWGHPGHRSCSRCTP